MHDLIDIIPLLIESFSILWLLGTIFNGSDYILENKLKSITFVLFYTIMAVWTFHFIPRPVNMALLIVYMTLLLSFITKINSIVTGITMLIFFVVTMVSEILGIVITTSIFNVTLEYLQTMDGHGFFVILLKIPLILFIFFIAKVKFRLSRRLILKEHNDSANFFIVEISMFIFALIGVISPTDSKGNLHMGLMISLFVVFIIINIIELKDKKHARIVKKKYEIQSEHIRYMDNIIGLLRQEKHEFLTHLCAIKAMCYKYTLSDSHKEIISEIKEYTKELTDDVNYIEYYDTGNGYVDALLTVKYSEARSKNIELMVNVANSLAILNLPENELISIISNLVDNSIESFNDDEERETNVKFVCVTTHIKKDNFIIEISNNGYPIKEEHLRRIYDRGFTTKGNSREHGYGLFIVKRYVEKNSGRIMAVSDLKETKFIIKFKIREDGR